jgi:DnaK suppressor protein
MAAMKRSEKNKEETPKQEGANHQILLMEKRQEVMQNLGMTFDTLSSQGRVAEEDQAQLSHDEYVQLQLNKKDWDVLLLVNAALDRLNAGDYGICQRCEEPIARRRLEVIPWAKYCVTCQEKISRRHAEEDEPVMAGSW